MPIDIRAPRATRAPCAPSATPLTRAIRAAFSLSLAATVSTAHGAGQSTEIVAPARPLTTVVVRGDALRDADSDTGTSRTPLALRDQPASIQVVPRELLRERGVTRTDELLDTVSGVLAESSYGGNGATFFNIRGFSENNGLRDGFRNYGYLAYRDVQNIERVEVFKGPAGALYGGVGAVGGYVNTVSKRPLHERFGEVALTVGQDGLRSSTFDLNGSAGDDIDVRLNGAWQQAATVREHGGSHAWSLAPALVWRAGPGSKLTVLAEWNHLSRDGFDFGVPNIPAYQALSTSRYYGLGRGNVAGVQGDFGDNDTQAATVLFEQVMNERWHARLAAHYSHARQRSQQSFPNIFAYEGGATLDYSVYSGADETSRQLAVQAELLGEFRTGAIRHAVLMGLDYGTLVQGGAGSAVDTLTLDLFNGAMSPTPAPTLTPTSPAGPFHAARGTDLGAYVQDQLTLSPQWQLQLGLRADRLDNREVLGGATSARGRQNTLSPRVGVVWQPEDRDNSNGGRSWFADWSRSHAPNVAHSVANATYDAEVAQQVEVGVKQDLADQRVHASVALFRLQRANILTSDPNDPARQVLSGRQSSRGVEFDLAGTVAPGWKLNAAYTYTDAVVDSDTSLASGARLSNVPRHHASAWSSYEFQSAAIKGLGIGGGLHAVGAREANLPNTYLLAGYTRFDAMVFYRSGAWRTQLNVSNLFDRRYYTGGAASVFNYALAPGRPRAAQLTVAYRF